MQSIRILAGRHKNRRLDFTPRQGVRPTCHRLKGTVFNILAHRFYPQRMGAFMDQQLESLVVIDAFSGVGSYGFEALSRGAEQAVFIEGSPLVAQDLKGTIQKLCYTDRAFVWCKNLPNKIPVETKEDIIFMDPPYDFPVSKVQDVLCWAATVLAPEGVVVLEFSQPVTCEVLECVFQRKTSRSYLSFFQHPSVE
jgi:16S rRNA (guanine966-N2)-methyltransferase